MTETEEPVPLSIDMLPAIAQRGVRVPGYDVTRVQPTMVHIGPGVFHRGHQAVYADSVLGSGSTAGGICVVALRSADVRDALGEQDHLYSVLECDNAGDQLRVVGSIRESLVAPEDPEAVLRRMTDPQVSVVTMTVTEKGYCAVGATGELDGARPEIAHDIATPGSPRSLPGFLVEALARRRSAGTAPFTVASCDNLRSNGASTRRLVTELAAYRDDDLASWITSTVAFPSSMVDRMVPATTDAVSAMVRRSGGYDDRCPVVTERFSQWVLEDVFPAGRPEWERAGVELVSDVEPFEQAKLRILNGAHSAFAYLGLLCGYAEIADAAADPDLRHIVVQMLHDEVIPVLSVPPGMDLTSYAAQVLSRFENRALGYTTAKVAADGSQKLPIRILATARDRLAAGGSFDRLAAVFAAYAACLFGPASAKLHVDDPALVQLLGARPQPTDDADTATDTLLGLSDIVGDLAGSPAFVHSVRRSAAELWRNDPRVGLSATSSQGLAWSAVTDQLGQFRLVPVVVLERVEDAWPLGQALRAGGLPCAEVTFRTAAAEEAIREMSRDPGLLVGAGTVVSADQVDVAVAAGACFVVSPGFNLAVVRRCQSLGVPVLPGVATPSEVMLAMDAGLDAVKFFPAEAIGGVGALRAIAAPFGSMRFVPTGGVSAGNLAEYLRVPAVLAVGGSWMVAPSLIAGGDFAAVTRLTAEAVSIVAALSVLSFALPRTVGMTLFLLAK